MENENLESLEENNSRFKILLDDTVQANEGIMLGQKAPQFLAHTTIGDIKLSDFAGDWLILFSHPGDFTPVCTTEFISFAQMYQEFKKRNCNLLGLSIDSTPSHLAWINNIYKSTGIQIPFPIISDSDMSISQKYSMISKPINSTQTIRSVFFIDPNQKIRAKLEYPMTNGRNIGEILRLLEAMQLSDKENVATPANWIPGAPTIVPSPKTYQELIERINSNSNYNCMDWYLCFSKVNSNNSNNTITDNFQDNNDKKYLNTKENISNYNNTY